MACHAPFALSFHASFRLCRVLHENGARTVFKLRHHSREAALDPRRWLTERVTSRCYGRLSSTSRLIGTVSAHCDTQKTAHEPSSAESARRLSDPLCDPSGRTSRRRRSRPPVADQHFSLADLHILMCGECGSLPQHAVASPAQTVGQ